MKAVRKRLGSETERGSKENWEKEFMNEALLNFDQGILLILKWEIGKDGIVNEELIREWSEKGTDSAEMDGLVKEEEEII